MDRIKGWGRSVLATVRGDFLTYHGKLLTLIVGQFLAVGMGLIALLATGEIPAWILVFGYVFLVGYFIHQWLIFEAPNPCPGPRNTYTSPSGEVVLFICHGCESWGVAVRGDEKGHGNGHKAMVEKLRALATTHQRNVPHLAQELHEAADNIESDGSLKMNERYEGIVTDRTPEEIMEKVRERLQNAPPSGSALTDAIHAAAEELGVGEKVSVAEAHVLVPESEFKEFLDYKQQQQGQETNNGSSEQASTSG